MLLRVRKLPLIAASPATAAIRLDFALEEESDEVVGTSGLSTNVRDDALIFCTADSNCSDAIDGCGKLRMLIAAMSVPRLNLAASHILNFALGVGGFDLDFGR